MDRLSVSLGFGYQNISRDINVTDLSNEDILSIIEEMLEFIDFDDVDEEETK